MTVFVAVVVLFAIYILIGSLFIIKKPFLDRTPATDNGIILTDIFMVAIIVWGVALLVN